MTERSDGVTTPRYAGGSIQNASMVTAPTPTGRGAGRGMPRPHPTSPLLEEQNPLSQICMQGGRGSKGPESMRGFESHCSHRGEVEPLDVNGLLAAVASLDPENRQVLKHHLSMYEAHDFSSLHQKPIAAAAAEEWKDDLKADLRRAAPPEVGSQFESLNYAGHDDHLISRQHRVKKARDSGMKERIGVWCVFILIGVLTGVTAFGVKMGEEFFGHWRLHEVERYVARHDLNEAYLVNLGLTILFVTIAVGLTYTAPSAAGSGVPDVKALLNGVRVRGVLSLRAFVVKVLGVIFGVASGLAMGPEGPMIHAGAILAGGISQAMVHWPFKWAVPFMRDFRNDTFKRDAISAGAAAGVAAAFGAPIGGLLFSMEEASSFWSHSQTWRTMITCLFGTFTMTLLVYGGDRFNDPGLVHFGVAEEVPTRYELWEMLMWIPLAVLFGLLGALFNFISVSKIAYVLNLRARFVGWAKRRGLPQRGAFIFITMLEAWIVCAILVTANFELARTGICSKTPEVSIRQENETVSGRALHFMPFECEDVVLNLDTPGSINHKYNDVATLTLLPQLEVIRVVLSRDDPPDEPSLFSYAGIGVYFPVYFMLTVLTAGLFMPQGLFVPHIVIGALGGRLYGMLVHDYIGSQAHPGTYALMGACGMLAGSTRIAVSLSVIMFEITNDIQYLVPLMLVVVIAKNVGGFFNEPYYDSLLELRHIPVLEEEPPHKMDLFHVGDLMHPEPICATRVARLHHLRDLLVETRHACFPVVRSDEDNTMLGSISRESINIIMMHYLATRSEENPMGEVAFRLGDPHPATMCYDIYRDLEDNLRTENRKKQDVDLTDCDLDTALFVDLLPYVNLSTFMVPPTFSLLACFNLFRSMALRHVVVVNTAHAPIGILTRSELQKHFLYVWLEREDARAKHSLTTESLQQLAQSGGNAGAVAGDDAPSNDDDHPTFHPIKDAKETRISLMAGQLEAELGSQYGASFRMDSAKDVMAQAGGAGRPPRRQQSMHEQLEAELESTYYGGPQRATSFRERMNSNSVAATDGGHAPDSQLEMSDINPHLSQRASGADVTRRLRNNTNTSNGSSLNHAHGGSHPMRSEARGEE